MQVVLGAFSPLNFAVMEAPKRCLMY